MLAITLIPSLAFASPPAQQQKNHYLHNVINDEKLSLTKILDSVTKNTGKKFLVNSEAPSKVVAYGLNIKKMNFDDLLLMLEHNDMAVYEESGYTNIIRTNYISKANIPIISGNQTVENPNLWVTKIIDTGTTDPTIFLPVMRSLAKQSAHMAPFRPTNAILLVAPYHNVIRLEKIVRELNENSNKF